MAEPLPRHTAVIAVSLRERRRLERQQTQQLSAAHQIQEQKAAVNPNPSGPAAAPLEEQDEGWDGLPHLIFITGLCSLRDDVIVRLLAPYGHVRRVNRWDDYTEVNFSHEQQCQRALQQLHDTVVLGRMVQVTREKPADIRIESSPTPMEDEIQHDEEEEEEEEDEQPAPRKKGLRRHIADEEDDDDDEETEYIPAPLVSCVSQSVVLTPQQVARKNTSFNAGDVVKIEYTVSGESFEQVGFGQVVAMNPIPLENGKFRTMRIKWLYDRNDLLNENDNLDDEALGDVDFGDGDWAFSDLEQEVNVYNVVGKNQGPEGGVEFHYDGQSLRRLHSKRNQRADPELPRHLCIVRDWLLSHKIWDDTKYGSDLWFTLISLLSMGYSTNLSSSRHVLQQYLFDGENHQEPRGKIVHWRNTAAVREKCDACGITRLLSQRCDDLRWNVGGHCSARISVLAEICLFISQLRKDVKQRGPAIMSGEWLDRAVTELNRLRTKAMDVIAAAAKGQHD